ncbi:MAG: peptide-methionine (S)-S-oxide reductase MsrA [Oleiphilaceae bacterium]|nr:peptide-methionine (S)-S-oxide reductase MsrA [Oleiphilaceae bacterium]
MIAAALAVAGLLGLQVNAADNAAATSKHIPQDPSLAVATFAGGCFWCIEAGFEKIPGVEEAVSGYAGGEEENPTYNQVAGGRTGHTETVQVFYDPSEITYEGLVQGFWRMMDPTDAKGSFVDRGAQYRPAIFYHNDKQKQVVEEAIAELEASGPYDEPIVVEVVPFETFYVAEDYHQDYHKENPVRYKLYTFNSGRYQFVEKIWGEDYGVDFSQYEPEGLDPARAMLGGKAQDTNSKDSSGKSQNSKGNSAAAGFDPESFEKPSEAELKERLTPIQYEITQKDGTEPAYDNPYWDEKRPGLYVDVVSGEPLYSSSDKYKSNTGWPSFIRAIDEDAVVTQEDRSWFGVRTELRSAVADSHLGHLFEDGPKPTGLRHCINSAALKFIPKDEMAEAGYEDYIDQVGEPIS